MIPSATTETNWRRLSEFIAERMGLHFPPERRADLQRGLAGAAAEFGFADINSCGEWLLSTPLTRTQLQALASHLTVGETYFFREKKTFDVLAEKLLPELVHARRGREQRLRLWSAACCTGEEPYSLAILLHQIIPDVQDWHVTILATDINERFLQKAANGVYREWSFRETPAWFKERYFQRATDGRYAIQSEIKKLVTFAHLNLVEDVYPSLATDTNAMDVVFCRNVLMYFTPAQAGKVARNLHHAVVDGGWLVVSPSEASQTLFPHFATVNFPGVILYRKEEVQARTEPPWTPTPFSESTPPVAPALDSPLSCTPKLPTVLPAGSTESPRPEEQVPADVPPTPSALAASLYHEGRYAEATDLLLNSVAEQVSPDPQMFSLLARALANQGRLAEALAWCERWIAADKLDAPGHYLRAVVLQELGDREQAQRSLQRAIYLQPGFVLAHFALGNLARISGKTGEADKHLANALDLLGRGSPEDSLPESDGLTAGRLKEIITSLVALEGAP